MLAEDEGAAVVEEEEVVRALDDCVSDIDGGSSFMLLAHAPSEKVSAAPAINAARDRYVVFVIGTLRLCAPTALASVFRSQMVP